MLLLANLLALLNVGGDSLGLGFLGGGSTSVNFIYNILFEDGFDLHEVVIVLLGEVHGILMRLEVFLSEQPLPFDISLRLVLMQRSSLVVLNLVIDALVVRVNRVVSLKDVAGVRINLIRLVGRAALVL